MAMAPSPDHHSVPRIAPAADLHGGNPKSAASPPAASPTVPVEPRKGAALSVSRQWVLPPRPKPGRKPKNLGPPAPKRKVGRPLSSLRSASNRKPTQPQLSNFSSPQTSPKSTTDDPGSSVASSRASSPSVTSITSPSVKASKSHDDDVCNMCTRDDCMCETIGLKPSSPPKKSLPSLGSILNDSSMIKMDAVPLQRNHSSNGVKKFRKIEALRPVHPPLTVPSSIDGASLAQQENCGFCTENSACACAEASQVQQQQTQPQNVSQHRHSQPSPIQPIMGFSPHPPYVTHVSQMAPHLGTAHPSPVPSLLPSSQYQYMMTPPAQNSQLPLTVVPSGPVSYTDPTAHSNTDTTGDNRKSSTVRPEEVYSCPVCEKDAMSMLFCLSIASAPPLNPGSVSLPCNLAFKTLQKHHRFEGCDLGKLVTRLEVSNKQVGVQSINRVLQELDRGDFIAS